MRATINILVVGDDEETCIYLAKLLSAKDWQTDTAWVGSKALELARNNAYDAIVFDYRKPGLDGAMYVGVFERLSPAPATCSLRARPTSTRFIGRWRWCRSRVGQAG